MDTSLAVLKHSSTSKQPGYVSVCRQAQDATKEPPNNPNNPINLKGMHAQLELTALLQTSAANPTRFKLRIARSSAECVDFARCTWWLAICALRIPAQHSNVCATRTQRYTAPKAAYLSKTHRRSHTPHTLESPAKPYANRPRFGFEPAAHPKR